MSIQQRQDKPAHIAGLFFKAAIKKGQHSATMSLPLSRIHRQNMQITPHHFNGYCDCIGWTSPQQLPPTYLHVLAFQMQLELMVQADNPFAVVGLVHIENQIEQYRPISIDEHFDIVCSLDNLQPHPRGWQFDVVTQVLIDNQLVWRGVSTNLSRAKSSLRKASQAKIHRSMNVLNQFTLPASLGRQYAKYSGDYNPIHLFALSARLFGFKQQIAHGMWSKARCLAALSDQLPDAFKVQVQFMRPVFLPTQVELYHCHDNLNQHFELTQIGRKTVHLQGTISSID
ncbi:MaoC family dehydratase [Neptunicella sp.]|uniref:MaoC family dehydratase n=1 Tax=Neptunicella sp. TaxID=2125986 RepID=UPI003F6937EE